MQQYSPIFPNSIHEFKVKVGGLYIVYQLDFYERWIVHIRLALGWGTIAEVHSEIIGIASEYWISTYFEDTDFE
jgi:hypothetical protein